MKVVVCWWYAGYGDGVVVLEAVSCWCCGASGNGRGGGGCGGCVRGGGGGLNNASVNFYSEILKVVHDHVLWDC